MIIATAGHVDHGKTTLVRALTGVDTDRLPEEKKRGLTIDIGFAYQDVAGDGAANSEAGGGTVMGFVDVPGHERFVKNMLAGVASIDFALLVVAADDGVMPQTEEHLAILGLLGIKQGAVAITKIDRVEPERVLAVKNQVTALLAPTPLAGSPLFPVSGELGTGMAELQQYLETAARRHAARDGGVDRGHFRLSIDRAFTVPGAGLIVTGAVFSGRVAVGDRLILASHGKTEGIEARVRGLRALDREAEIGRAGQRCAINIAGADLHQSVVSRGDWLLAEPIHAPVRKFDARVRVLDSEARPLAHWTPVHLHLAAADVTGRIAVLGDRNIMPGEDALAQLVLDAPIGALFGDRFILRDQSAQRTLAGGVVIDPFPPHRGRARPERLAMLGAMETEAPDAALIAMLAVSNNGANNGVNLSQFAQTRNLTEAEAANLRQMDGQIVLAASNGDLALSLTRWQQIEQAILAALAAWHEKQPEAVGPNDNALRTALMSAPAPASAPVPAPILLAAAIGHLVDQRAIVRDGMSLRLPSHSPRPSDSDLALWKAVALILEEGGIRPPRVRELAEELKMDHKRLEAFMQRCARQGRLMAVAPNRFFPPAAVRELAEVVERLCAAAPEDGFTAATFKNDTGIGRNVAIEVLEFFDTSGLTRRQGNVRYLRRPAAAVFGEN
ncbi:MAG: selenocysteine-specific translation elongation factor [Alphaproteobacteria bacterium]|nr:selenocysteine-specific translation elongation factor [Alphaproteobacteria bacterium]